MPYINKGDKLLAFDQAVIAVSSDYVKMVYDSYDYELSANGYEGGTSAIYVDVQYPNGIIASIPLKAVKKV